jgi:hypothetical protein
MILCAGATAGLNCSLCEAGTYGTGSGPVAAILTRGLALIQSVEDSGIPCKMHILNTVFHFEMECMMAAEIHNAALPS